MNRMCDVDTIEEMGLRRVEPSTEKAGAGIAPAGNGQGHRTQLGPLMRTALDRRAAARSLQEKLRRTETELRRAPAGERLRFERMRAATLQEYRSSRVEASRTRQKLIGLLGMLRNLQ
jgi:hypothetical protein